MTLRQPWKDLRLTGPSRRSSRPRVQYSMEGRPSSDSYPSMGIGAHDHVLFMDEQIEDTERQIAPPIPRPGWDLGLITIWDDARRHPLPHNLELILEQCRDPDVTIYSSFPPPDLLRVHFDTLAVVLPVVYESVPEVSHIGQNLTRLVELAAQLLRSEDFLLLLLHYFPNRFPIDLSSLDVASLDACLIATFTQRLLSVAVDVWDNHLTDLFVSFLSRAYVVYARRTRLRPVLVPRWTGHTRLLSHVPARYIRVDDNGVDFYFIYLVLSSYALLKGYGLVRVRRPTYRLSELTEFGPVIGVQSRRRLSSPKIERVTVVWPGWVDASNDVFLSARVRRHRR
ncbi:hypothetical protein GMRT_13367 [Giardia muris]|uniref:Uncharacterized protein n=1 Tax=Giardia muris TaxID=5742 RepID=A0A4Z1SXA3_GIAMU|nr:hypothetical protein GMRT_13367 [Giardia muris]|eukprot:TNJ26333.1 hypothetical protein GMRT_13367 [Giardia muris]